jgi:hypothetical protein
MPRRLAISDGPITWAFNSRTREIRRRCARSHYFARVSTTDQNLEIQEAALKAAGCEVIRSEEAKRHEHGRPRGTPHRDRFPAQRATC